LTAAASPDRSVQKDLFIEALARVVAKTVDGHVSLGPAMACESMDGPPDGGPDKGKAGDTFRRQHEIQDRKIGGGFGFTVSPLDSGSTVVAAVIANSSASKAGVKVGDELISINGLLIPLALGQREWLNYNSFNPSTKEHIEEYKYALLTRAPVGSHVDFQFSSGLKNLQAVEDESETLSMALPKLVDTGRGDIGPHGLEYANLKLHELEGGYAYLPISSIMFKPIADAEGPTEIRTVIQEVIDKKYKGLLIDTRGNGGGADMNVVEMQAYLNPGNSTEDLFYEHISVSFGLINSWCENDEAMKVDSINGIVGRMCKTAAANPMNTMNTDTYMSDTFRNPGDPVYIGPIVSLTNGKCISSGEGVNRIIAKLPKSRAAVVGFSGTAGSYGMAGGSIFLSEYLKIDFPFGTSRDIDGTVLLDSDETQQGGVIPTEPDEGSGIPSGRIPKTKENVIGFQEIPRSVDWPTVKAGKDVEVNYALTVLEALAKKR